MPNQRNALVAGATGLVGRQVVAKLVTDTAFARVTAWVRRPGSLELSDPKLHEQVVDFDRLADLSHPEEDIAATDVFCCLGTTLKQAGSREAFRKVDHDYILRLAERALAVGAERFLLVSSVDADAGSRNFYLCVKGEVEKALAGLGYEAVHVFRPSFLVGPRRDYRRGEKLGIAVAKTIDPLLALIKPLRRYRPIAAETVAAAMVAASKSDSTGLRIHQFDEMPRTS